MPRSAGAWRAFVDPRQPAPTAPVIWLGEGTAPAIYAGADRNASDVARDFDLERFAAPLHVHFGPDGAQYVVIKSPVRHVTLVVRGHLVTVGSVKLAFTIPSLTAMNLQLDAIQALAHIALGRRLSIPPDRPGAAERLHLRDAIIAYDGERAGMTRREIATVIYDAARVAAEWTDPNGRLKAVIKRDVRRGRHMVAGGWRDMILAGTFGQVA